MRYGPLGLNLNGIGAQGDSVGYSEGNTIMTLRRGFEPSGERQGMVFSTTTIQNDDGITIRGNRIGTRTHSSTYQLKGTSLTTVLPEQDSSESFAMRIKAQGASFHHGAGWSQVTSEGEQYDSCAIDRFFLGSNDQLYDPWDDGDLFIQSLAVFSEALDEATISAYLEDLSVLF